MKPKTDSVRSRKFTVRLSPEEFEKLQKKFQLTIHRKLSDYLRHLVLEKPVTVRHRNQSLDDFMHEMIALRNELNAIGNNYNQVVKRLHTLDNFDEIKIWLLINETARQIIFGKVTEIKEKISQINDIWCQ